MMKSKSLTRFGTYGFLCALIAAEMTLVPKSYADDVGKKADEAVVEAKKEGRAVRRKVKKQVRKATGNDSVVEDVKDAAKDGVQNTKDEINQITK